MKKILSKYKWWLLFFLIVIGIILGVSTCNKSSNKEEDKNKYLTLEKKDLKNKMLISGTLSSSKEVNLKSELPGVIKQLFVSTGDQVKKGQAIAKIKFLPDPKSTQDALRQVSVTSINVNRLKDIYARNEKLFNQGIISRQEYELSEQDLNSAKAEYNAALKYKKIVEQGYSSSKDFVSNVIYSTIDGIVLEVPVKVGETITNRNQFNEGTTISTIADMNEVLFKGQVSENGLRYLNEGKEINININALRDEKYTARVSKISPKGVDVGGITRFDIEAKLNIKSVDVYKIKSGFTATADFIRAKKDNVWALEEKYIQFAEDTAYVWIQKGEEVEKAVVNTGISDGKYVEIQSGLSQKSKILKDYKENDKH